MSTEFPEGDPVHKRAELALTFASDTTKQVLTLATTILAFTVTFRNDVIEDAPSSAEKWLWLSWIALGLSIVLAIVTFGMMTGQLGAWKEGGDKTKYDKKIDIYARSVRIPSGLQIATFAAGLALLAFYGVVAIRDQATSPADDSAKCEIVAPAQGTCTVP